MPILRISKIESQSQHLSVTIETHDEHHMGASTVMIIPSRQVAGVSRFQTTNGDAFFTSDGNDLFIHDANVVLFINLATGEVFNYEPPKKWYFTRVRLEYDSLLSDLFDGSGNRKANTAIPLVDLTSEFARGFGQVVGGRFPSAYP